MTKRAVVVCDQWLGSNGYAAMKALRRAGWSVKVAPEREFIPVRWRSLAGRAVGRIVRSLAVREFNSQLLTQTVRHKPDFLLVFKGTFVNGSTLSDLRERGIRTYCFYPDVSFRTHGKYLPTALPEYDWVFTTKRFGLDDLRAELGITEASVLLHAYDADLHRPVLCSEDELERYMCDVSFIGTWSPKKEAVLSALAAAVPSLRLRIWGEQWSRVSKTSVLAGAIAGHEVTGEEYVLAITASRINLGILSEQRMGASSGDQVTSRTFHIPAVGGFMLHERTDELLEIFTEDVNVACYSDAKELVAKVMEFLPQRGRRHEVARQGRAVVETRHSWDHRIQEILVHHAESTA